MLTADTFSPPQFSWNLVTDVNSLLQYPYMRHAFVAGALVGILGAVVGWYAVLRSETYATHTLAVVGFPGASGAVLLGLPPLAGYLAFCISGAFAIPALTGRGSHAGANESAAIGSVQAFALALGLLFVSLYHGFLTSLSGFLFGTFTGVTYTQVVILLFIAISAIICLSVLQHRLMFASLDRSTAAAAGVPVRLVETLFLILLGCAVAEASQFTGALLAFTLTITPAAVAQLITPRPGLSLLVAPVAGVLFAWAGLTAAYFTNYPVGFFVTTFAFAVYVLTKALTRSKRQT